MPRSVASRTPRTDRKQFADDVEYYLSLTPRQLPSRYLYDGLGSALFEAICRLPWYRITRTEQRLLRAHAGEILARVGPASTIVELGPGGGQKLTTLLAAGAPGTMTVHLVDVSREALDAAARAVSVQFGLAVVPHRTTYEAGLLEIASDRGGTAPTLVLFLGSNIGNFDTPGSDAFLRNVRAALADGDSLLISADLIKPEGELLLAYDDPLGVTAAFNLNLLVRANGELGADFDVDGFAHRALWNADASRIEMHLVSRRRQRVHVPASGLDVTFGAGETIWTESSYKYQPDDLPEMLRRAGFNVLDQWIEDRFALTLADAR